MAPGFGADAAELLAMDGVMSADVTASIANDAARLPAGSVIVVDDFHAAAAAGRTMTDLVERWPARTAQLVLASRVDPPVRLHRLRLSGELCELRDSDLYLSLPRAVRCSRISVSGSPPASSRSCTVEVRVGRGVADGRADAPDRQGPGTDCACAGCPQPRDRRVLHR